MCAKRVNPEDPAILAAYWIIRLVDALAIDDLIMATEAGAQLRHLGFDVSPRRRRRPS